MTATPASLGRARVLAALIVMLAFGVAFLGASARADLPPDPIVPEHGEVTLLDSINSASR